MKINNLQKSIFLTTILSLIVSVAHAKGGVNLKGVPALITSTYIFALIFAGVFLLLAAIVSNAIKFQGGENPRDAFKRRMWFWIFAILGPVSFFIYNILMVIPTIKKGPAVAKFGVTHIIGTAVILVVYILIGFVLSKVMKKGKIGNWFPSKN
jgi:methionine sulfoxide reductase heme-binding subunit